MYVHTYRINLEDLTNHFVKVCSLLSAIVFALIQENEYLGITFYDNVNWIFQ